MGMLAKNWFRYAPLLTRALAIGLLIYAAIPLDAAAQELPDMIIRNVLIMEPGSKSDHTLVNIQIRNGDVAAVRVAPM